ncbi:HNH endonuclease domain-containing protein [Alkalibacter mobilis]|uniref:HNH endonuclease domain-containing protein n=1 Tax=Alkalibacter mobilis TaxID=2787712 RepID=UPI00189F9AAD|nr:HNH endonuclease domain-containing protein [Alkalibacter mobilis]MBF7097472.1 HNH endonuclease [Alkalibacter mobilis]
MFVKYKQIIEKLNYFEWIKFLEKVNPNEHALAIAEKLDCSAKRTNLSIYREYLYNYVKQDRCFYCNKQLRDRNVEVDHFIPWSFVKDDKLWNFVLSCSECNNKKRNKLAGVNFKNDLIKRNHLIIEKSHNQAIETDLSGYRNEKIVAMYNSAAFNGFDTDWIP